MRTSLNDIKLIEDHLFQRFENGDSLPFEARLILDPALPANIAWQQKSYDLIRQYGRKKIKNEIEAVHQKLFSDKNEHAGFRQKILKLFSKI